MAITPQFVTDVLILLLAVVEVWRRRRAGTMATRSDRGTMLVFGGCYAITLLALNTTIPSPVPAVPNFGWIGAMIAALGLGARVWTACADGVFSGYPLASRRAGIRRLDHLGNLALWVGAAAASENLIVVLTVTVAMLPATVLRNSAEEMMVDNSPARGASGGAEA